MADTIANTVFVKILPVLLTAAIIWIISSISTMQVQSVRIEEQVIASHKLLTTTSTAVEKLESKAITQQITIRLLEKELETLQRDFEIHLEQGRE